MHYGITIVIYIIPWSSIPAFIVMWYFQSERAIGHRQRWVGPAIEDLGDSLPCRCICSLCPWARNFLRCIASFDPGANGCLWGQICKLWCQVACDWPYTPPGSWDGYADIWTLKSQWPRKVLVKDYTGELWGRLWTQTSNFTFVYIYIYIYTL